MRTYPFGNFKYGVMSKLPVQEIPDGAASDSLNWQTMPGRIELSRGYTPLGSVGAVGRITGLKNTRRADNTNILFRTDGVSLRYYSASAADWVEIGTNLLGSSANGEDITMDFFEPIAGKQLWVNSPHAGPYKVMVANPGDATSMYDSSKNYKAWMRIFDNQAYIWNIDNVDKTAVRLSYIETRGRADYSQVVAESVSLTLGSGTLAQKASTPKATFFDITATCGAETFTEDLNGNLTGSAGGTGTINYTTGVITFAPIAGLSATASVTYRYVDETATWGSHGGGIMNFVVPGSRVSGEPNVFRQDHGGDLKTIVALKDHKFCAHLSSVYDLLPNLDDTKTTNTLFRDNINIQSLRGIIATPEGIYGIDVTDLEGPAVVLIAYAGQTPDIKPRNLSRNLDLSSYLFDQLNTFQFSDFVLFSCRTNDSPYNNRTILYNRLYRYFDILDYAISCADTFNNLLYGGDPISNTVYQFFSGFDANGDTINNYWKSGISKLGYITPRGKVIKIFGQKKVKKILLEGNIGPDQTLHLYASTDRGAFVEILDEENRPIIQGSGSYIDKTQSVTIGSDIIGDTLIGGGSGETVPAYHYEREINFNQSKFSDVQFKFVATGLGYLSITRFDCNDLRVLQNKPTRKYRVL